MFTSKKKLIELLDYEKSIYFHNRTEEIEYRITGEPVYYIWKYIKNLRITEFYHYQFKNQMGLNKISSFVFWNIYRRKKNRLGLKLGIEIGDFSCGKGLHIWHAGAIVINGNARIGSDCSIHGAVCIGNNGKTEEYPIIGDEVDIGVGAYIIGPVKISSKTKIGAGAVVVHSAEKEGSVIIGPCAHVKEEN